MTHESIINIIDQGLGKVDIIDQGPRKIYIIDQGRTKINIFDQGPKKIDIIDQVSHGFFQRHRTAMVHGSGPTALPVWDYQVLQK